MSEYEANGSEAESAAATSGKELQEASGKCDTRLDVVLLAKQTVNLYKIMGIYAPKALNSIQYKYLLFLKYD